MAKLSGVEIIIIIGVGFAVFVILFIVAHRQIARFKVRDLLSRPLLKHSQFGASLGFVTKIQRDIAGVLDIDVQPQMWDDHWNTFFKSQSAPGYVYRAKALDFTVLLKLELLKFGTQFDWTAFEDLGEYFDRLKMEYPINKLPVETVTDFLHIYRRCRFDDTEFSEREHDKMNKLVTDLLVNLEDLRLTSTKSADRSYNLALQPLTSASKEMWDRDKPGPKKFPKGYELLDSDGSTAGSMLARKGNGRSSTKAKLKRVAKGGKSVKAEPTWEEQVPLRVFHDNPLINFEPAPSTSRSFRDKIV